MSNKLSVYNQLVISTDECLKSIGREIGMKSTCVPFAVKAITALKTLTIKTEEDALNAANTFLGGLQTLCQGGIVAEDYDKIDFIKRGNVIVLSARVEAFLRAAARKGYRITDTIIAVPQPDANTTFFKENFYQGDIIYTLEDMRKQPDRAITAQRLVNKYFNKFICRLDVHDIDKNQRVAMVVCEISIEDMLNIASASEQGIYKSKWEEYDDGYGKKKKRKVLTDELNTDTFWIKWTSEMVNKTIIRRALKRVKEVLPELKEAIFAFDKDEYEDIPLVTDDDIEIPIKENISNVDLKNLTEEQQADCLELYDLFVANPKLAEDKFVEIKTRLENGEDKQNIINDEYASITVLMQSKTKSKELGVYFNEKD